MRPNIVSSSSYEWSDSSACWVDRSTLTAYRIGGWPLGELGETTVPHETYSEGKGYRAGGYVEIREGASWGFVPSSETWEYNFASKGWKNLSSVPLSLPDMEGIANGRAVYVPSYGLQGLVVLVGGLEVNARGRSPPSPEVKFFEQITFFDIASKQWYQQNTTGPHPITPRQWLCALGKESSNGNFDM